MSTLTSIFTQMRRYTGRTIENLEIKIVRQSTHGKVKDFLRKYFYKQDPLHTSIHLHKHLQSITAYEKYLEEAFNSGLSVMMMNPRREIIGLCLNRVVSQDTKCGNYGDERCQKIAHLIEAVDQKCDLFHKFGVDKYLKLEVLTTDPLAVRGGIEKKLTDVTKYLAQQNDMKLIRLDATGHYDARNASNLGFMNIYSVDYENYVINDKPVFKPSPPNTNYSVFVQTIEEDPEDVRKRRLKTATFKPIKEYL